MTDSYERSRTQTFTEEELEQFDSDAAVFLTQDELEERLGCSGQLKLATALQVFQYRFSDSFGGNPPL